MISAIKNLRHLGWDDLRAAIALALFVGALLVAADCIISWRAHW